MDSSIPPPPSQSRRKLRPWYLVATMVLTWFFGIHTLQAGLRIASILRGGTAPDVVAATRNARGALDAAEFARLSKVLIHAVEIDALQVIRKVTFPLSIAQVLLAALLVLASSLAMAGRPGARSLALQALFVNAAFLALAYALTRSVRGACIDAMVRAIDALPRPTQKWADAASREVARFWWEARFKLIVVDLGTLAVGAIALTRPRTKLYFDAVAEAAESAEEP